MIRIDDLLYFEPYAYINAVFAKDNPNQVVSRAFLDK